VCGNESEFFLIMLFLDFSLAMDSRCWKRGTLIQTVQTLNQTHMKNTLLMFVLLLSASVVSAQTVTGTVTAETDGAPLPGVSVVLKGTTSGTTTDTNGKYTLDVNKADAVLVFSFIGMATREIEVGGRSSIDISLAEDITQLGEVVVTALGISREKKSLGFATATVDSKQITQTAPTNFATALYGKAPGVRIAATPGGPTSAVNITIRGVNSILLKNQPLIVMNGVPIRDGEASNNNYWADQRLRGTGLLDINPEDIENISILKGASAAALYGSDAVNGVVLITTKTGKGTKGFKVDFSTSYTVDKVAYLPRYQNVRGPGAPLNIAPGGQDEAGFIYYDVDGDGVNETRGVLGYSINFGPKFDGQPTMTWDGQIRPYVAQKNNYSGLFQDAHNKVTSVAVSSGGENYSTRLSFTRQDNEGISLNSENDKNIVNLNSSFKLGKNFSVDAVVNYINQKTKNRPYSIDRLTNNFGGMMGRFDNSAWYLAKYKTSLGYRFVTGTNQSLTPEENIIRNGLRNDLMDYVWRVNENRSEEKSDRVISSLTSNWQIIQGLNLRGRFALDVTSMREEDKNATEIPLIFGVNTGGFTMQSQSNTLAYGDVMLSYNRPITEDVEINVLAGYSASKENNSWISRSTTLGLSPENLFDISASVGIPTSDSRRLALVKDALIGTVNANYKDIVFLEGTIRRDRTSTMHPSNNSFVYPSVNSSFVFSDAFDMPQFLSYGKVRASWGIVGNYPDPYMANVAYTQKNLGVQGNQSVIYTTIPTTLFGNDNIKPEQKHEIEFGLETKFLNNRAGIDFTYYNGQIRDQILDLSLPVTSGAEKLLTNIGTLRNKGIEIALSGTPIRNGNITWDVMLNLSKNRNIVEKLYSGANELLHADWDGNAAQLRSVVGRPMGDIYVHPVARHENGEMIVDPNGLYKVDPDTMVRAGNYMPKLVGGLINSVSYKGFTFTAVVDFRYGGHVMPTALNWMISRGLLEESLNNMDEEHGGLAYYQIDENTRELTTASEGPNGEPVYHDGMVLPGVKEDGTPNDYVASATDYYWTVYNWGGPQYSPNTRYELFVKENSYVKMREISLSYRLPQSIASKIRARNIELSVFGRNLFFFYRTIKDMDPEQTTAGSRWYQNVNNIGTNPATRTYGGSLRVSF
jgi:iron complex outermembrane recepter protein